MLRMGMLGELDLGIVLQRAEVYAKTGLLLVKQGEERVELYLQQGRLLCIGPVKAETTLWDRLLQAGVISPQARQEAMLTIGTELPSEVRMALTLISLGYMSHERLRAWVAAEAMRAIQLSFTWTVGELYFEDGQQPPIDRYLVDLPIGSLLASIGISAPQSMSTRSTAVATTPPSSNGQTLMRGAELLPDISSIPEIAMLPQSMSTRSTAVATTPPSSNGQTLMRGAELLPDISSIPEIAMLPQGVDASTTAVATTPTSSNGQTLMRGSELLPDISSIPEIAMLPQGVDASTTAVATTPASSNGQTLMRGTELLPDISSIPEMAILPQGVDAPDSGPLASGASMPSEPRRVSMPLTPVPIDTSFMRPEMVLVLRDLSLLREQKPQMQLTPEQWYLFARADGNTSLQNICQMAGVHPSQVCLVAGELMALGLVHVLMPTSIAENAVSPSSVSTGLSTGPLASSFVAPFKTQSQGDTSERDMTFVHGYGWVHRSQLLQMLEPSGSLNAITHGLGQMGNGRYPI